MSRYDRSKEELENQARRARRLAERAEERARRKAAQAEKAAERAARLAERVHRRRRREKDFEASIEDFVDEVTEEVNEKWARKAQAWAARDMARDITRDRRRRERARRARRRRHTSLRSRLISGKGLYRDTRNKKICGVCAGIADYLSVENWKVRLVAVAGVFFMGQIVIPAYFIACWLMDPKPYYKQVTDRFDELDDEFDDDEIEKVRTYRRKKSDRAPKINTARIFRTARAKFADIEERLRAMESHVTSSRFELQRELRKIAGEE